MAFLCLLVILHSRVAVFISFLLPLLLFVYAFTMLFRLLFLRSGALTDAVLFRFIVFLLFISYTDRFIDAVLLPSLYLSSMLSLSPFFLSFFHLSPTAFYCPLKSSCPVYPSHYLFFPSHCQVYQFYSYSTFIFLTLLLSIHSFLLFLCL